MNGADFRSELTLPSHPDAIVLARAYARALATLAGLAPTELDALVDAVTTACADVTRQLSAPELTPFHDEEPLAPPQTYNIRRLRPGDALAVSQCVYRCYGYSYGNADLYYPQRIVHLNETGQLVSLIAVDEADAVVGQLALERPDLGPLAESGQAVVAPAHRGRHLLERLRT